MDKKYKGGLWAGGLIFLFTFSFMGSFLFALFLGMGAFLLMVEVLKPKEHRRESRHQEYHEPRQSHRSSSNSAYHEEMGRERARRDMRESEAQENKIKRMGGFGGAMSRDLDRHRKGKSPKLKKIKVW
jgi:hypothetical protein